MISEPLMGPTMYYVYVALLVPTLFYGGICVCRKDWENLGIPVVTLFMLFISILTQRILPF
jgi:hypothetical protein